MKKVILFLLLVSSLLYSNDKVKALMPSNFLPYFDLDENGEPIGFAVDVLNEVAKKANIEIEYIVKTNYIEVEKAHINKEAQLIVTSGITEKRKENSIFSTPYSTNTIRAFKLKDTDINRISEIKNKTLVLKSNNVALKMFKTHPKSKLTIVDSKEEGIFSLLSKESEVFAFNDYAISELLKITKFDDIIVPFGDPILEVQFAFRIHKDYPLLASKLDIALKEFMETEKFNYLSDKWLLGIEDYSNVETPYINYTYLLYAVFFVVVILLFLFIRTYQLNKFNLVMKNRNKEIEELNSKLNLATSVANIGIWKWNIKSNEYEWDDNMLQIYGVNKKDIEDKYSSWLNFLTDECKINAQTLIDNSIENKTLLDTIIKINTKEGLKHIKVYGKAFYEDGKPSYMVGTNFDITNIIESKLEIEQQKELLEMNLNSLKYEKERSQVALEEAQVSEEEAVASQEQLTVLNEQLIHANEAKSEFLSNMSHEIRTPLTGIIGIVDILLDNKLDDKTNENLFMVKNSANNLKNIINDILDYSKIQAGKFEIKHSKFDLKELVDGTVHMFKVYK
jgi:ABC-type amino acid transport substrate-binding protein